LWLKSIEGPLPKYVFNLLKLQIKFKKNFYHNAKSWFKIEFIRYKTESFSKLSSDKQDKNRQYSLKT